MSVTYISCFIYFVKILHFNFYIKPSIEVGSSLAVIIANVKPSIVIIFEIFLQHDWTLVGQGQPIGYLKYFSLRFVIETIFVDIWADITQHCWDSESL